ncbi:MAG: hypothetical protein EOL91_13745, partial [Actinobacteria bacterium]|nr:hypothetical protein [Actinomycetota bacterium]
MRRRFHSLLLTVCLLVSGGLAVTAVADNRDDLVTQQERNDQLLEQLRANLEGTTKDLQETYLA